jgi:hypothetical protein
MSYNLNVYVEELQCFDLISSPTIAILCMLA